MRIMALLLAGALVLFLMATVEAWNLEMDDCGPGSEFERTMEESRDRDNRDSVDRVGEGTGSERDYDRAREYEREHGA